MSPKLLRWEIIGIIVIILAGSALHFVFAWTGRFTPVALFAAVNESTWEHLKLAFWPALIFALIEYRYVKALAPNFWPGKTVALWLTPILIVVIFYAYQWITGTDSLVADISIFAVAIIIGQLVGLKLITRAVAKPCTQMVAWMGLGIIIAAFCLATFFPPKIFLFKDPISNGYGIVTEK